MMRRTQITQDQDIPARKLSGPERLQYMRRKLDDRNYMAEAVQRLAQELSIEIMENTYGIPFR